jgi:hypothetical protein
MEIGKCLAKEQLLKLYPDAHCQSIKGYWQIIADNKMISHSFISEEMAWERSLLVTNHKILEKFAH